MEQEKLLLGKKFKAVVITLKNFPIHIEKTDNKYAPNKFIKINNQSIYNGALNRFARNTVVTNLHNYIIENLPNAIIDAPESYPLWIKIKIRTVENHGAISLRKGKLIWKQPEDDYEPNWDEDNLSSIWNKVIRDSLSLSGMIPDDNVNYIRGGCQEIEFVDDINDRELIIKIERYAKI